MKEEGQYNEADLIEEEKSENNQEVNVKESDKTKDKKIKNLISLVILLAGLFVGSLFVDCGQLIQGGGISQRVLNNKDVFQLHGKTWVAYTDPIVKVKVINDDDCESCKVDQVLLGLRKMVPTVLLEKVDYNSDEGKKIIKEFNIKSLPAFVFDKKIKDTDFYVQAQSIMKEKGDWLALDGAKAGIPAGKYVELPKISDEDIVFGKKDAPITLIEFSDFQCPYCKVLQPVVDKIIKDDKYKDKVKLAFKYLPLESIHPSSMSAALAAACAQEQGKFIDYAEKLFDNQKEWSQKGGEYKFKVYARQLGLDVNKFNQCYQSKKYEKKIKDDIQEAQKFGISGTPALFIGDEFKGGAADEESIRKILDEKLAK